MKITKLKQSNVKVVKSTQPGRVGVKETFEHIVKPRGGNGESKDPKPPRGAPK
jgi:hypothetical protein